ncbi:HlyD family secretion protein [Brevibacillus reuszeri]|uniref:HlyD family secretion protein n=1 Tax=Brevibacillus reuszeri TaxID=54915 RepID=UPI00289AE259|nr:HlyD family efflux transporter periplasmic adaptor subunit [Brevibacillus reuszeri]
MKRLFRTILTGGLVLVLAGCTWLGQTEQSLSGTVEAEELPIVAEVGGLVTSVKVEEGSAVTKGQVLAEIDKRSYQIVVDEAKAALEQATIRVEEAKAGSRDSAIQKGIAGVQQADANVHLAEARKKQADAGIVRAQEQLAQSESQLQGAQETLLYQQRRVQEVTALFAKGAISKKDLEAQQEAATQAQTQLNQLKALVAQAEAQVRSAQQDAAAAMAQTGTAQAQVAGAKADLDLLKEGSTDYTIRALLATQQQAQAKLDLAKLQLEKAQITAAADGALLRSSIEQGEVAKVGATLFTMMKADRLKLVVYIPEAQLNRVQKGQEVSIHVDAYLDETFKGRISTISEKAEFTPKNVQTPNERTKLVFAVTISITEGLDKIKPGMPADVLLADQGGAR